MTDEKICINEIVIMNEVLFKLFETFENMLRELIFEEGNDDLNLNDN